jgi:hypothetical protein
MPDSDTVARAALEIAREEFGEALQRIADRLGVVPQLSPGARRQRRWRARRAAASRQITPAATNGADAEERP